jgi:DNA-binding CsgD family transcriptional regulator
MTFALTQRDYNDVLEIGNLCISSLKINRLEIRDILSTICEIFISNNVEFFPPNDTFNGVNLGKTSVLHEENWAVKEYADFYWQIDPLYNAKFCPMQDNAVFKTDDIIPFDQLINHEYYKKYLVHKNCLNELIIQLRNEDGYFGTFSISRALTQPDFNDKDVSKAKLVLPYLLHLFQGIYHFSRIETEAKILKYWFDLILENFFVIDSNFNLKFSNEKAQGLCQKLSEAFKNGECRQNIMDISLPSQIFKDCKYLFEKFGAREGTFSMHRIISIEGEERYCIRYLLIKNGVQEPSLACFITSMDELINPKQKSEEVISNGCELSLREQTIIRYIASGLTNKELGQLLSISQFTVQNHLQNIFQKTGIVNRTQLANLVK